MIRRIIFFVGLLIAIFFIYRWQNPDGAGELLSRLSSLGQSTSGSSILLKYPYTSGDKKTSGETPVSSLIYYKTPDAQ